MNIPEPTSDQCSSNDVVFDNGQCFGVAIWYPQMGGYIARAVACMDCEWREGPDGSWSEGGCIDVYVWHDGEFPFSDDGRSPRMIHHCDPDQFIEFGETLAEINARGKKIVED